MGIFCETIIVKSQLVNLFSGEFLPFGATVRRRRRSSGGGVAFYASRIREETRPWPKYESQGAVESEDQLLFFAAAATKRLLLLLPPKAENSEAFKLGHHRSLVFGLLLWPRSLC